jgi:hypothetical protein
MQESKSSFKANNHRFQALVNKLDSILFYFSENNYIVCNSNLHISRNHPAYLALWAPVIYKDSASYIDLLKVIMNLAKSVVTFFMVFLFELLRFNTNQKVTRRESSCTDFIVVSHLVDHNYSETDFYFGQVLQDLALSNKQVSRLLIPHIKDPKKIFESNHFNTYLLNIPLRKKDVLKIHSHNVINLFRLIVFSAKRRLSLYEIIVLTIGQLSTFRLIVIIKNIQSEIEFSRPKNLITTFEGNSFERAIFALCKRESVTTFGYQHAPIIASQNSILKLFGNSLDPDFILCSGTFSLNKYKAIYPSNRNFLLLGSPKFVSLPDMDPSSKVRKQVLLVPDGNLESIDRFLRLAVYLCELGQEHSITIRSHPLYYDYLSVKVRKIQDKTNLDLHISTLDLTQDLLSNNWLIYENSSVSIQGLLHGCLVVYLKNQLSNIDPLWESKDFHLTANNFSEVNQIIKFGYRPKYSKRIDFHKEGGRYFSSLNSKVILDSR